MAEARDITELSLEELAETERLESELDQFIEKRVKQAKEATQEEEQFEQSKRKQREKKRQSNGWGWIRHYQGLADAHRALADENDSKADVVRGQLGLEGLPAPSSEEVGAE